MKILNIAVDEFAGLGTRTFEFCDGFNIIEGENESGKSSLLAFIKFMLYGLGRRASGDDLSERERYLSWTGRRAAGSMTVISGGRLWKIERELYVKTRGSRDYPYDSYKIIDLETGVQEETTSSPGEFFLGIPDEVFISTCAVAQSSISGINSTEVGNAIENLLLSANENLNAEKAVKALDNARRLILHRNENGGELYEKRRELNDLKNKLNRASAAVRSIGEKENLVAQYKQQADFSRSALDELEKTWEASEILHALGEFDMLRESESRRNNLKDELTQIECETFPDGFIPDKSFATELTSLARELNDAESALPRAEMDLEKLRLNPPYDENKLKTAKSLLESGVAGTEGVRAAYRTLKQGINASMRLVRLFFGGFLAFAAVSVILFVLSMPLYSVASAIPALAAAAGAVISLLTKKKRKANFQDYISKFGFTSDPGERILIEYIDGCFASIALEREYTVALEARRGVVERARERLEEVKKKCRLALEKTGCDEISEGDEKLSELLMDKAGLVANFCIAREELQTRIKNADEEIAKKKQYLLKFDEPLLRRRAEALPEIQPLTEEIYKSRKKKLNESILSNEANMRELERRLIELKATTEEPAKLALQIEELENKISALQLKHSALELAAQTLAEASGELRRGVTPKLRKNTGKLLEKLSGGRYTEIGLTPDLSVTITAQGITRPLAAMSGGTKDAVYISLRIALASLLCSNELPPLLIDEGLSMLDESRAQNLLALLYSWCESDGGQCLLFTCHKREHLICQSQGYNIKHILLTR